MIAPKSRHDCDATRAARQCLELAFHRALHRIGKRRIIGDQDRLRGGVVFGLRQQVRGDPRGVRVTVGDDQDFGRSRDHVDADLAEDEALCGRHVGVAGSDDLGDG